MESLKPYAKAFAGGLVTAIAFAVPVVDDGLLASEILGIAGAFLAGLGVVYRVPNGKRTGYGDGV